jgi:hypothetical protein
MSNDRTNQMSISLSVKPLGNAVAGTDYIFGILDTPVTSKLFGAVSVEEDSDAIAAGDFTSAVNANYNLPQLATMTFVTATDPVSGNVLPGQIKVALTPDAADTTNASSPMTYVFSANAMALTNASAS